MVAPDLEEVRRRLVRIGGDWTPSDVANALRELGWAVSDALVLQTVEELHRTSSGWGPLEVLRASPGITDILVNGPDQVYVDAGSGLVKADISFDDDAQVRGLATRLAAMVGRRLDDASPWVDARLPDGTRLHAVLGTLADPGTCISLRLHSRNRMGLDDWVANGSISQAVAELLAGIVTAKLGFLVCGGTGSGKTTLLSALLGQVSTSERILIVEDSREIEPSHPHCVRLECRPPNSEGSGAVTMTDLVRQALRMRPDRLVVGEVRGAELCDLLAAMNTGHEGGCGTVHANSVADVPARLEALAALGGMGREACHAQSAAALDVVIQVVRLPNGRRAVTQIGLVANDSAGHIAIREAVSIPDGHQLVTGPGWEHLAARLGISDNGLASLSGSDLPTPIPAKVVGSTAKVAGHPGVFQPPSYFAARGKTSSSLGDSAGMKCGPARQLIPGGKT